MGSGCQSLLLCGIRERVNISTEYLLRLLWRYLSALSLTKKHHRIYILFILELCSNNDEFIVAWFHNSTPSLLTLRWFLSEDKGQHGLKLEQNIYMSSNYLLCPNAWF